MLADVLLVLFFALERPWSTTPGGTAWLGAANDVAVVVQFAALVPVVTAVSRRLPPTLPVRLAAGAGALAALSAAALQVLLLARVLPFEDEVPALLAACGVVCLWILGAGLAGHRTGRLPRPVSRCAVLLGPALPVGLALTGAARISSGPAHWALLAAGLVAGVTGWLALPLFPLLVARYALPKEEFR